jgi:hypothetical protein
MQLNLENFNEIVINESPKTSKNYIITDEDVAPQKIEKGSSGIRQTIQKFLCFKFCTEFLTKKTTN